MGNSCLRTIWIIQWFREYAYGSEMFARYFIWPDPLNIYQSVTVLQKRNFSTDPVKVVLSHILIHYTKPLVYSSSLSSWTALCEATSTAPIRSMVSFPFSGFLITAPFCRIGTHIAASQKLSCTNKMKIILYASNRTFQVSIKNKHWRTLYIHLYKLLRLNI